MGKIIKSVAVVAVTIMLITAGAVWWGYAHLTGLVQNRLRNILGDDLSIGTVTAHWNRIELQKIVLLRSGKGGAFDKRLAIDRIELNPRLKSLVSGRLELGVIRLENPYILAEISPEGALVPFFPKPRDTSAKSSGKQLPVIIDGISISGGNVDVLDWYAGRKNSAGLSNPKDRYHVVRFGDISFSFGAFEIPINEGLIPLQLSLKSEDGGSISLKGRLSPKSGESGLRLDIVSLNLVRFRPYFLKPGDLGVSSGFVTVGSDISVINRQLKAPGTVSIKNLAFDHSGTKGIMMGLPAAALVNFMADNKGELKVDFLLSGNLDNPRFTVRESFVNQLATALSGRLGVTTAGSVGGAGAGIVNSLIKAIGGK